MKNLKKMLSDKKVRYGTFSTITALIVIAALVVVNLIVGQIDASFDLTKDKLYSISDKTKEIIGSLDQEITIYALFVTGNENQMYVEILEQYSANSNKVSVAYKDPILYPSFVNQYKNDDGDEIGTNSIIVAGESRYKVIAPGDLITTEIDYNTYSQYVSAVNIEPKVTNAIEYVLQDDTPKVYSVDGHGEEELAAAFITELDDKNFAYATLDILKSDIPEDCAVLMLTSPRLDYTKDEATKITDYLADNGKALFVLGNMTFDHPNLDSILSLYGVQVELMSIIEADPDYYYPSYPVYFYPHISKHDITNRLVENSTPTFVAVPQNIGLLEVRKSSLAIEPLLMTSAKSYGKTNPNAQSVNWEEGDAVGPFNLALAITDSYYTLNKDYSTKIVISGAPALLDPSFSDAVKGGNALFISSSLEWLADRKSSSTYIAPKSIIDQNARLSITSAQASKTKIITTGVIPGVIFIAGFAMWLWRRHK